MLLYLFTWLLLGVIIGSALNIVTGNSMRPTLLSAVLLGALGSVIGGITAIIFLEIETPFDGNALMIALLSGASAFFIGRTLKRVYEGR